MMLGLGSVGIALAFWLCLAAAVCCVVYGVIHWNDMGYVPAKDKAEGDK